MSQLNLPCYIHQVPEDVLETIFIQMTTDPRIPAWTRLQHAITSTHVCSHWRHLIIETPIIWARNIVLRIISSPDERPTMLSVIYQRAKSRPLWVDGTLCDFVPEKLIDAQDELAQSTLDLLERDWERIENISIESNSRYIIDKLRNIMQRPAPILRYFFVSGGPKAVAYFGTDQSPHKPLFFNHAPLLHRFETDILPFFNLTCLTNLRIFHACANTRFRTSVRVLLSALQSMRHLEELKIDGDIVLGDMDDMENLPFVELSFLTGLFIHAYVECCIGILKHIRSSPSGCMTSCKAITSLINPPPTGIYEDLHTLYSQIANEHISLAHSVDGTTSASLLIRPDHVQIQDRCRIFPYEDEQFTLAIVHDKNPIGRLYRLPPSIPPFNLLFFRDVAILELSLGLLPPYVGTQGYSQYHSCLSSFTSVTTLEVQLRDVGTLGRLIEVQKHSQPGCFIFPKLRTLRIISEDSRKASISIAQPLGEFVIQCQTHGCTIRAIEFPYGLSDRSRFLKAFENHRYTKGFKILWKEDGIFSSTYIWGRMDVPDYDFVVDGAVIVGSGERDG